MSDINRQTVLIVGGGFAGIKTALELSKEPHFKVQLLTDRPTFRYYPTLYHTATGGMPAQSSIPLSTIFKDKDVDIIIDEAVELDRHGKTVKTTGGQHVSYDLLVIALGVKTNYFGIKGLDKYAYGIKSLEEAEKLKTHLHQQLIDDNKPDLNYVIIGAGPTGIELAGQLPSYLREVLKRHGIKHKAIHINLVEAAPKLLPRLPKDASRAVARHLKSLGIKVMTGQAVQAETESNLVINGQPLSSHTVIWTAGVTNHPFFKANQFTLNDRGKVVVDKFLQAEPSIYVLGDNADTPFSGMAQTALHDSAFLTANLKRRIHGKTPVPYKPKQPITVIPVGPMWAAVIWGKMHLYGRIGWFLRETADLRGFADYEPWWRATEQWLTEFSGEESCNVCLMARAKTDY